jgi:hypothetical protein
VGILTRLKGVMMASHMLEQIQAYEPRKFQEQQQKIINKIFMKNLQILGPEHKFERING